MTPAEQRLTDHLATVVCGWTKVDAAVCRYIQPGHVVKTTYFDPIHDPRDCAIVMEAWRTGEHELAIDLDNASKKYTVVADYGEPNAGAGWPSESWTEAVCEAIADASGYEREGG